MKPATLEDPSTLRYPILITPKYDGIRAIVSEKGLLSNSLKLLPNSLLQRMAKSLPLYVDLEVCLRDNTGNLLPFNEISSWVMSENKSIPPEIEPILFVFDSLEEPTKTYRERLKSLYVKSLYGSLPSFAQVTSIRECQDSEDIYDAHCYNLSMGYEGSILRSPDGIYKNGRSTLKEQYSIKLKPFEDTEGTLVDWEPRLINLEESKKDERGLLKKGKKKANLIPTEEVGVLILKSPKFSEPVRVGSGLDNKLAKEIYQNPSLYLGKMVKFKYLPSTGEAYSKKPRHPVFIGFRDEMDLTDY